jgi:hypothetical protein
MFRRRFKNIKALRPSAGTVAALLIVAGGMAFALLQSQARLTGNSIHTASAGLVISQNDTNYGPNTTGYDFSGVIPGSQASQTEHLFLKNTGSAPLSFRLASTGIASNPSGADLDKVHVILTPYQTGTSMPGTQQSFSLQSLIDADAAGGLAVDYPSSLAPGSKEEFNIQIAMDADAISGSGAALSGIDLGFTGSAQVNAN